MEQLHQSDGSDIASLLCHVAAHEIGHLLLGTNSHSTAGLMHAHWTAEELASAKVDGLVFLEKESRRMRAKLTGSLLASREGFKEGHREASKEDSMALAAVARARLGD